MPQNGLPLFPHRLRNLYIATIFNISQMLAKRGQLGFIEFKYFLVGLIIGIVIGLLLIYLGRTGVIPFTIPYACPAVVAP